MRSRGATSYLDDTAACEQHVGALEVPMHDVLGVDEVAERDIRLCDWHLGLKLEAGGGGGVSQAANDLSEYVDDEIFGQISGTTGRAGAGGHGEGC
jgi:hypothetical protein